MSEVKVFDEIEIEGMTWEGRPFRVRFSPRGDVTDVETTLSMVIRPVHTRAVITAECLANGGLWWMLEHMLRSAVEYARTTPPPAEVEDLAPASNETVYDSIDDAITGLNEGIEEMEGMIAERGKG